MNQRLTATSVTADDRSQIRRRQLLVAATECFRRYGFHNATVALISKHADMSVGQIYHYFANKEAIIAACVEQQLEIVNAMYDEAERASDIMSALVEASPIGMEHRINSGLMLEVHAEASRNPVIAKMMSGIDQRLRERITQLITRADAERGAPDASEPDLRAEALLALQIGVHMRLSVNAGIDREKFNQLLHRPLRAILEG